MFLPPEAFQRDASSAEVKRCQALKSLAIFALFQPCALQAHVLPEKARKKGGLKRIGVYRRTKNDVDVDAIVATGVGF